MFKREQISRHDVMKVLNDTVLNPGYSPTVLKRSPAQWRALANVVGNGAAVPARGNGAAVPLGPPAHGGPSGAPGALYVHGRGVSPATIAGLGYAGVVRQLNSSLVFAAGEDLWPLAKKLQSPPNNNKVTILRIATAPPAALQLHPRPRNKVEEGRGFF